MLIGTTTNPYFHTISVDFDVEYAPGPPTWASHYTWWIAQICFHGARFWRKEMTFLVKGMACIRIYKRYPHYWCVFRKIPSERKSFPVIIAIEIRVMGYLIKPPLLCWPRQMAIPIYTGPLYGSHSACRCPSIYQCKAPGSFVTTNLARRDL